jgi:hypothetical protein
MVAQKLNVVSISAEEKVAELNLTKNVRLLASL